MSAPYHMIHFKLEDVLKQYIAMTDLPDGVNIYTFADICTLGDKIEEPFIGLRCPRSVPALPEVAIDTSFGNRIVSAEIAIITHAEDIMDAVEVTRVIKTARDSHADLVGQVLDQFYRSDIIDALNAATSTIGNIGIDQVDQPEISTEPDARSYKTIINFAITCHPNS